MPRDDMPKFRVRRSPSQVAWHLDMLHVIDGHAAYLPLGSFATWSDAIAGAREAAAAQGEQLTEVAL